MRRVTPSVCVLVLTLALAALPPVANAAPTGATFKGDPQAIAEVQTAFAKFNAARTWRARIASGGATTMFEYVAPDRFHMVLTANNQTTEIFNIGQEMWIKGGGNCQKPPVKVPVIHPKDYMERSTDTTITVTKGVREAVDGTATQTYLLAVETRGTTTPEKMYVATGTELPRRIEVQSSRGTTVIDYFDFDAAITINPPC